MAKVIYTGEAIQALLGNLTTGWLVYPTGVLAITAGELEAFHIAYSRFLPIYPP